jgi:DMSO/TMAO reductase YedYZ molybdopterin-dependent catalytic subunit
MFDSVPQVNVDDWRLVVAGRSWSYAELASYDDKVTALLDCTGGWYSEQTWEGVLVQRLLPPEAQSSASLNVRSLTGYSRRFDLNDAPGLLLATRVNDGALDPGLGFPVRLVAPGRRGFTWVKWVSSIDAEALPWWWQPPFPLQ